LPNIIVGPNILGLAAPDGASPTQQKMGGHIQVTDSQLYAVVNGKINLLSV
jgi:hypothetical protein